MAIVKARIQAKLGVPRASLVEIVEYDPPDFVVIRDVGPWGEALTVTNNVEAVVADLFAQKYLKPEQPLYYFDSDGQFDQIVHDGTKFVEFMFADPARWGRIHNV